MRFVRIYGSAGKIKQLIRMSKEALRDGAYRVASRLHAIALNMEGRSAPEIARLLKVHRSKVSIWLRNYRRHGVEGLLEGHRSGRPREMSQQDQQRLSDILESGPVAYGLSSGVWTTPMVARVIENEFSITYHPAHVSRILHAIGFSVQRPRRALANANKVQQQRWTRYKYPNIKKKPILKGHRSSTKTRRASGKTQPSTAHGHG